MKYYELHTTEELEKMRTNEKYIEDTKVKVFELVCKGKTHREIEELTGVPERTIRFWKTQHWFKEMWKQYSEQRQKDVFARMAEEADDIFQGYMNVMRGGCDINGDRINNFDARMASAIVNGMKLYMEAGPDPLIKKNPNFAVMNNTQINNVSVDPKQLNELSAEELLEAARTGVLPEKTVKMINE